MMYKRIKESCIYRGFYIKSIVFLMLMTLIWSCDKNELSLVKNGDSNYYLLVPENLKSAGAVLNLYIKKISGVHLKVQSKALDGHPKIVLSINDSLAFNEILIKTENKDIIISGGSSQAVKNGIYEFLEQFLGVKWLAPEVDYFTEEKQIVLPADMHYNYIPQINTRTVHSRLFYNNPEFAAAHKVTTEAFPYYVPKARVHTFHRFLPEEQFFKEHPEYYALRENGRTPTQLCLTNAKVLEIVKDSVKSLFEQYPEAQVISVSQDDNQQYCLCDQCAAIDEAEGSPAGKTIRFVNAVAAAFPKKTISTLAYQHTRKPPKTKPLDNVLITLCSIECDRSAPIEEKCTDFAEDLKGWSQLTNQIRIWDYTTQFTNFLAPFPNIETLEPNIKFLNDNHTKWVFEQHSNQPSELFELRSYITAKLLWNPALKYQDLLVEFTDAYYQEAGKYVREYVNLIHKEIKRHPDFFLFLYGDPSQGFDSFLSVELLEEYNAIFDRAEREVLNKPEILKRVKAARLGVDYASLEACKKNLSKTYSLVKRTADTAVENDFVLIKLDNFEEVCDAMNITAMNEMGFTVEEYIQSYRKALEVALKPNKAKGMQVNLLTKPKKYANEDPQVLTDGALGGNNFYANWLGFEGEHMEAIVEFDEIKEIHSISTAFLQVTNHVVFYPLEVDYEYSLDGKTFNSVGVVKNQHPLTKQSKVNDIQYFDLEFDRVKARYVKIKAKNMLEPPYWHHAAGLPSWIFADEIIID